MGVYDCVDGGILFEDSGEVDEDEDEIHGMPGFSEMCGAIPKCTTLPVEKLNPSFIKYVVQEYDIKLELLENTEIRFCCALFHSTLQRLVTSPTFSLQETSTSPISCQGKTCAPGAVGCLLHAVHDEEYDDYEEETKKRYRRLALNDYIEDEDDYVNAVELNFEDTDLELITREPPVETTTSRPTLPSLKLPMSLDDFTTTQPMTTTTPKPKTTAASVFSKSKTFNRKHSHDEEEEEDEDDLKQSTYCVYRHLNNEFYRYCLLVHQSRDGDRCYHHQGHTICCCFVAPDKESCDPTEMDLIVPPPMDGKALPPRVIVTIPPSTTTTTTTTTTEEPSTTTTTTTTTPEPTLTTPEPSRYPELPPQVYRPRPIDQMKKRKQTPKKCRVAYVRTKSGSRTRPVLVCETASASNFIFYPVFLVASIVFSLQVFFFSS